MLLLLDPPLLLPPNQFHFFADAGEEIASPATITLVIIRLRFTVVALVCQWLTALIANFVPEAGIWAF